MSKQLSKAITSEMTKEVTSSTIIEQVLRNELQQTSVTENRRKVANKRANEVIIDMQEILKGEKTLTAVMCDEVHHFIKCWYADSFDTVMDFASQTLHIVDFDGCEVCSIYQGFTSVQVEF